MKKGVDFTGVAVVFACHDGKGKLLFAKRGGAVRDGEGTWELPAGGVKFGEPVEDALLRELKEELCVTPVEYKNLGFKDVIQKDGEHIKKHWVTFEYLVLVNPDEVAIGEPEACSEIGWFTPDTPPQPLHFGVKETLDFVVQHLKS